MNIGFVSTAHIHSKGFIETIRAGTDGRRVAFVWDDNPDRGRRHAALAQAPFFERLDDALAKTQVDGFIICAENTRHASLLRKLLPLGQPIFCEKPLVTEVSDLEEIRALRGKFQTPLFSGFFQVWRGDIQAVAQLVRGGAVGKVLRIRYRTGHRAAFGRWFDSPDLRWFHDPALSGGGAFLDMGTHALHLVRTLFGPITQVWAEIGHQSGIYSGVDDFGIAQLRFASGVLGTVEAAWTQTGGIDGLEVIGTEKAIWNTSRGYMISGCDTPIAPVKAQPETVERLMAVMQGKISAEVLLDELEATYDTVKVMAAAYRSAKVGSWIPVHPAHL
jgi:predicted dehydrogenase